MKYKNLFSEKTKNKFINLLSVKPAQRVVKVKMSKYGSVANRAHGVYPKKWKTLG